MSVIIDTGCANLTSLKFAVERLTQDVVINSDPGTISSADRVFLPGVGSAQYAMGVLEEKGLLPVIQSLTQPVLGICLGMQMLTSSSSEGDIACLDLIPGEVRGLQSQGLRLPHMGWNTLTECSDHQLLYGIRSDMYFYFVHSFGVGVSDTTIAQCEYGSRFSAAIAHQNFMGVQFHPERSSAAGAQLLKNFLEIQV
ncbi:MAG: imidazole glycerol phosphate synthase subunit HisH [Candidatus Marinimicrobia bacterium]|nr:imidazole glycerol phosphate synthase subunit HisH [FCB group bacterium]MBL7023884.1 imidazole glycerol phosphate synthase subunit HisH [Candidatus Neomarinimicrobiota bacterium]